MSDYMTREDADMAIHIANMIADRIYDHCGKDYERRYKILGVIENVLYGRGNIEVVSEHNATLRSKSWAAFDAMRDFYIEKKVIL